MFSKFSVLPKLCKYFNSKRYGLLHISRYSRPTRELSKTKNKLLEIQTSINCKNVYRTDLLVPDAKGNFSLTFFRNMSSMKKDGEDIELKNSNQNQKSQKVTKSIMRRRLKFKRLKNSKVKCKRCKHKYLNKIDVQKPEVDINKRDLDLNITKSEPVVLANNDEISQSQFPSKKLHVEFMESQNLKDFNLNKDQPSNTYNKKPKVIDIKILPIKISDEKSSLNSSAMLVKNNLPTLKSESPLNSDKLPMLRNKENRGKNTTAMSSSDLSPKINNNRTQEVKTKSLIDTSMSLKSQINENNSLLTSKESINDKTIQLKIPRSDILTEESKDNGLIEPNEKDLKKEKFNIERNENNKLDLPKLNSSNQNGLQEKNISRGQGTLKREINNIRILHQARPKRPKENNNREGKEKNSSIEMMIKDTKEFNAKKSETKPEYIASKSKPMTLLKQHEETNKTETKQIENTVPKINIRKWGKDIDSVLKANDPRKEPPKGKSILYPTKLGKFLNIKINNTKGLMSDISESFDRISKGVLYPTKAIDMRHSKAEKSNEQTKVLPNILKTAALKQELNTRRSIRQSKIKPEVTNLTEQLPRLIKTGQMEKPQNNEIKRSSTTDIEKELQIKKSAVKLSTFKKRNSDNIKRATKASKEVIQAKVKTENNLSTATTNSNQELNKKKVFSHLGKKSENSLNKSPINMFGEYMSPNKLKKIEEKLKFVNTNPIAASPSSRKKVLKEQEATTLKTNKLTKFRNSIRGGGNRGGTRGGDGGDKINQNSTTSQKADRPRFWRKLSLSVLPMLIGFTIYIFSSIEAIEMFRRMHLLPSSDESYGIKVLPALYETDSENDASSDDDDEDTEEIVKTQNVKENKKESETSNPIKDHRLDEV